jgi:hypothetical protein
MTKPTQLLKKISSNPALIGIAIFGIVLFAIIIWLAGIYVYLSVHSPMHLMIG